MFSFWTSLDHLSLYIYIPKRYPIPIYGALIGTRTTTWRLCSPQRDFESPYICLYVCNSGISVPCRELANKWAQPWHKGIRKFQDNWGIMSFVNSLQKPQYVYQVVRLYFCSGSLQLYRLSFISLSHLHMAKYKHMIYSRNNNK